jgi:hypothetical protein
VTFAAAMALLASLRLSVPAISGRAARAFDAIAHPAWLLPLILVNSACIGLMIKGILSPWPPHANAQILARWGAWAGAAAFIAVLTVDLWLLWTPSMVARRFADPAKRHALRWLPLLNLVLGGGFLYLVGR